MKPRHLSQWFATGLTKSFLPASLPAAAFVTVVLAFGTSSSLEAASATWNGTTDATWATDSNWSAAPAPGTGNTATFNNAGNSNTTLNLGAGVTIGSIVFDTATAAAYTLGSGAVGSQALTLNNAGSVNLSATVASNQLVNANVNLSTATAATNVISNNSASLLTVAGSINAVPPAGDSLLTVNGSGNTTITGAINETGAGNSALLKAGAGTLALAGGGTYTGAAALGRIPATAAGFPLVAREGTLLLNGGTHTVNGELVIGGVVADGGVGQNAKIQIDAGTLAISSWLSVGRGNGIGTVSSELVANNAAAITAVNFSAGFNGTSALNLPKGSITLNGTSSLSVANTVNLAESAGSDFSLNINGTATFSQTANANQTTVAGGANSIGLINVNGGTASFHRDLILGGNAAAASGKLVLTSGTVNASTTVERWLIINSGSNSNGQIDVDGGNLNLNTNTDIRFSTNAASAGTNVVNLNGGAISGYTGNNNGVYSPNSLLDLNYASTSASVNNTFNLNGGTLSIGQIITNNDSGTAAFNFNGGTLKAAGSTANFMALGGATQKAFVKDGGAKIDSNGFNVTIVEPLLANGTGGLTKQGTGTLSLSGTSTFTGATLVSAGTLSLTGTGSIGNSSAVSINDTTAKFVQTSSVAVAPPVTLTQGSVDGTSTINSLTVANLTANTLSAGNGGAGALVANTLTFQGAATLNAAFTGTTEVRNFQSNDLTTNAAGKVVVNATNSSGVWLAGFYPVIYYYNTFTGSASDFMVGSVPDLSSHQTASVVDFGGVIGLLVEGDSLTWTGNQNSNWTTTPIGGASNWWYPSVPENAEYTDGNPVLFDDSASGFSVVLTSNVAPAATVFDNSTNDYTLSSPGGFGITGGSLTKGGTGKLIITNTNTYTGSTTINGGILQLGDGTTDGSIATSSPITANASGSLVFNLIGNHTYANTLAGAGSFIKQGSGTLTLAGANTFTGNFTLQSGQLNLNSAGALGAGPGTVIINGGTLDNTSGGTVLMAPDKAQTWNSDITFIGSNSLFLSNGVVTIPATRTVNVQAGILGTGAVNDGGAGYNLVKTGPGTLVLNGSNITGNLDIQTGIVGANQDIFAAAPVGTGILQNGGGVATKWTFWTGNSDVTSNVLIRNNDGSNTRQLGIVKRGTGTLTLTNNSNIATANLSVDSGRLVLNNTGTYGGQNDDGSTNTGLTALVGNTGAANGILEINGATVNYKNRSNAGAEVYRSTLTIGNSGTGAGAVRFTAGSLTTDKQLAAGGVNGAFGCYTQTGGTASIGGFLALGLGTASGVFNLGGGTYTMTAGPVTSGAGAGSVGLMNLSGGAIYNHNSPANNNIWLGENGTGVMNISGSAALTLPSNGIELGHISVATSNGTLNLLGGTVTTNFISKPGALATGTLNFNGGTLTANVASTTFLTGLTSAYVRAGGGTINNGGNPITIGQALLAPTGNGVSATGLTVSGGGYIATPLVQITGDGTGATAVATIDASGNLTGITITNPGNGYTTPPTFTLVGGGIGNTGAIGGTATLVANSGGGMAFTGAATTTLSGLNTYAGNTTVATGSTLALADDATLQFTPKAPGVSNKVTGAGSAFFYGDFIINTGSATIANGNTWTLVDVTGKTFDPLLFNIPGYTQAADVWTKVDGNNTWKFTEADGVLSLTVTTPAGYASWASANADNQLANLDYDKDGVLNGVEYFMGATGSTFTANPGLVGGTVTWPRDPNYQGSYEVQTSPDMLIWTNVVPKPAVTVGNTVEYTPAPNLGKVFVRLVVTPN